MENLPAKQKPANPPKSQIDLSKLSHDELLNTRICDLPIQIEGSCLEKCVKRLYRELQKRKIHFKPLCYLADEWLTPDQEPVVGIPFYLAHPRLVKLEKKMMLEAEGATREWCMKLLRHEAGHAVNYAYKLYRRKRWQNIFGKFHSEYSETYRFRPYSKGFVLHLEDYYAQYHPDEDFAETFAVWLVPKSDWAVRYKGWKALRKIEYVDELMKEIGNKAPLIFKGKEYWKAASKRITLRNYYNKKRRFYAEDFPDFHDVNLKRIFTVQEKSKRKTKARGPLVHSTDFIRSYQKEIINSVNRWTSEKKYVLNDLLQSLQDRCQELKLVLRDPVDITLLKFSTYINTLIMNYMYTGRFRGRE